MAPMLFARAIMTGSPIKVFNRGDMERDFTYIDDVILGIQKVLFRHIPSRELTEDRPFNIYNIGNNAPVKLLNFIETLEKAMGRKAEKVMYPMQPGDVKRTYADVSELIRDHDFHPTTSIEEGVDRFTSWFKKYYRL